MSIEIKVPPLGESVVEATVGRWTKEEGDAVERDEVLVELETDKITVEVAARRSGVLESIAKGEGDTVAVDDVLGTLSEDGAEPKEKKEKEAKQDDPASAEAGARKDEKSGREPARAPAKPEEPAPTSPAARKLAAEHQIDLSQIKGTGPKGRITKDDVRGALERAAEKPEPEPERESPRVEGRAEHRAPEGEVRADQELVRVSRRRQTIARRLVESQQGTASLTTFNEVDLSRLIGLRERRKEEFRERHGVKLGFMSFFVKASIGALKQFPRVNSELRGEDLLLKKHYDIGIAVGSEEGLVVPVVRGADRLTFAEIERTIGDLAAKVRDQKLALEDLQGGTFTITNGGVYGSMLSTPILNPPQVGILGMHNVVERPVVVDGRVVARPVMYLALTYDHRVVDGSEAVRFLVAVKTMLEDPETLLLEG